MTVATEKLKSETPRFQLVRVVAARAVVLSSLGGSLYSYSFGTAIAFAGATYSLATLTRVFVTPASNGQYLIDETTGLFTIYLTVFTGGTVPIVSRYLFFTSDVTRYLPEDPTNSATTTREWQPRLSNTIEIRQSQEDINSGVFSFDATNVSVSNIDYFAMPYLDQTLDTFFRKEIVIWFCIGPIANIERVYTGSISNISVDETTVSFSSYETAYALDKPAMCGLGVADLTYASATTYEAHQTRNRYMHWGALSWYQYYNNIATGFIQVGTSLSNGVLCGDVNYATPSTTTNRTWYTGFSRGTVAPLQTFGAITRAISIGNFTAIKFATKTNINAGDSIAWTDGGPLRTQEIVYAGVDFLNAGLAYDVIIRNGGFLFTAAAVMTPLRAFCIFVSGATATPIHLKQNVDYTFSTYNPGGGWYSIIITLANNFEATYAIAALDPSTMDIFYRLSYSGMNPVIAVQTLVEASGLTVDGVSFGLASTDSVALTAAVAFDIPSRGQTALLNYKDYITPILRVQIASIYTTTAGVIGYKHYQTPSSTDDRNRHNVSHPRVSVEYRDLHSAIYYKNPHLADGVFGTPDPSLQTVESVVYTDLIGVKDTLTFEHPLFVDLTVLLTYVTRYVLLAQLNARPRCIYEFDDATLDMQAKISDDVMLTHDCVLGGTGTVDLTIIGISKSIVKITVRAMKI